MQVTKVGDRLVVPLPDGVVEELGLKEGDEVGGGVADHPLAELEIPRRLHVHAGCTVLYSEDLRNGHASAD